MLYQSNAHDCGKTCVRNVLSKVYHDRNYYVEEIVSSCENFYEMRKELEQRGLFYTSYKIDDFGLVKKSHFPLIAQIQQGKYLHFVMVTWKDRHHVRMMDPQFGMMTLTMTEFLEVFTGNALLFQKKEKRKKAKEYPLLRKRDIVAYTFFSLIIGILSSLFFLYSRAEKSFLISLFFALGSLMFILLQNGWNMILRKRLEREWMLPYLEESHHPEDFLPLSKAINLIISSSSKKASYISLLIAVCTILLLNSPYYSILLLVALLFALLDLLLAEEKNKTNRYCSIKEDLFLDKIKWSEKARPVYQDSKRKAEKYLKLKLVLLTCEVTACLIFSLSIMNIEGVMAISVFFFSFGGTLSISHTLKNLFLTIDQKASIALEINKLSLPHLPPLYDEKLFHTPSNSI